MQTFRCSVCGQLLFFENSVCLSCGSEVGYDPAERTLVVIDRERHRNCANQLVARCNWLVPVGEPEALCASCRLTSVRPNDSETAAMAAFADAEAAKRRLLDQLFALGLPVTDRRDDPARGLTFELLSSRDAPITTGHQAGVITLDLSESDDAHREFVRQQLGEQYRTVLGHLRHEIGHYFWPRLVLDAGRLDEFRELFGDERAPYEEALAAHYGGRAMTDWSTTHVSQYATVHPWEDWAETFGHYLHIAAGLSTAGSFGLTVGDPAATAGADALGPSQGLAVESTVVRWLGLVFALNGVARSIGHADLYPFVLAPAVIRKLDFVHRAVQGWAVNPV
jgi:hypothetical protein